MSFVFSPDLHRNALQFTALANNPDILITTPGRLVHLLHEVMASLDCCAPAHSIDVLRCLCMHRNTLMRAVPRGDGHRWPTSALAQWSMWYSTRRTTCLRWGEWTDEVCVCVKREHGG